MDPRIVHILSCLANIPLENLTWEGGSNLLNAPDDHVLETWANRRDESETPPTITVGMVRVSRILLEEEGLI